jgi:pantetheine-phosphate adenylyltransferase
MNKRVAVYAGSFDPITVGHLDIAYRGSRIFDEVIIAIGENPAKKYQLPLEVRLEIIRDTIVDYPNIKVMAFRGLLVDFCREKRAGIILRGLRAVTDFEFEFQIGLANMDLAPEIETVFILPEPKNIFLSSSLVKEIASHGGDVSRYLPASAAKALKISFDEEG